MVTAQGKRLAQPLVNIAVWLDPSLGSRHCGYDTAGSGATEPKRKIHSRVEDRTYQAIKTKKVI